MRARRELLVLAALGALAGCSEGDSAASPAATGAGAGASATGAAAGGGGVGGRGQGGDGAGGSVPIGDILPDDRIYDWSPNVHVGVPGGIPTRTTLCATIDAATYGTGAVDASAALLAAINACPADQVVFIPAGTYRLDNPVDRITASHVTIRGAGQGQTILQANKAGMRMLWLGNGDRPDTGPAITAGGTKGSTAVTVADTTAVTVGGFVRLEHANPPYVISAALPTTDTKVMSVVARVTAKTDTTVTVSPPLPFDLVTSPTLIAYANPPMVSTGIEDLTFDAAGALAALQWEHAWGSWVKNIEVRNSPSRQLILVAFVNGEVRQSYFHDVAGGGPDHEGITLTADDHFNLIEDNISYDGGFPAIVLGDGPGSCHGNVIAYNFAYAVDTDYPEFAGGDISVNHGPHNSMNLVEGNISSGFASDGLHGSASHNVVFRNWFTATHPTATENLIAVNLGRWSTSFSLVGNVLGSSAFPPTGLFMPEDGFAYTDHVIYKVGYPDMGNNGFDGTWGSLGEAPDYTAQFAAGKNLKERDLYVQGTMLRHGNYDHASDAVEWSPDIGEQLPASFYRRAAPDWWPAALPWPPIGPDRNPMNGGNPAYVRFKQASPAASVPPE
jgi:hypothetical protein